MALITIIFSVKTQPWLGVMSSTKEHIHREKLDMHAGQFALGMKFTQNGVHKFNKNEHRHVDVFLTGPYISSSDQLDPNGSNV